MKCICQPTLNRLCPFVKHISRPNMAQAGGKDPSRLNEALKKAYKVVESQIK